MNKLHGLYAITDSQLMSEKLFEEKLHACLEGGARIVQYRDKSTDHDKRLKQATLLVKLCQDYNAISIINDDIQLAKATHANGLHMGKDDATLQQAREQLGDEAIIGISCYKQFELAQRAQQQGANYIAFGACFASKTKPNAPIAEHSLFTQAKQQLTIPSCAIGGITEHNAQQVIHSGADMIAVIQQLFAGSPDQVKQQSLQLSQCFK